MVGVAAAVLLAGAGCNKPVPRVDTIEDENLPVLSVVPMSHPRARLHLLSGFYPLEQGAWCWTMHRFTAFLRPPPGSQKEGCRLELKLTAPESVLSRRKSITLSADVQGTPLAPEIYTKPGDHVYLRDVPAAALAPSGVRVNFSLDKYLAAGEIEARELGVVVSSVGLVPKN